MKQGINFERDNLIFDLRLFGHTFVAIGRYVQLTPVRVAVIFNRLARVKRVGRWDWYCEHHAGVKKVGEFKAQHARNGTRGRIDYMTHGFC